MGRSLRSSCSAPVSLNGTSPAPDALDLGRVDVVDADAVAGVGERQRERQADVAAPADDDEVQGFHGGQIMIGGPVAPSVAARRPAAAGPERQARRRQLRHRAAERPDRRGLRLRAHAPARRAAAGAGAAAGRVPLAGVAAPLSRQSLRLRGGRRPGRGPGAIAPGRVSRDRPAPARALAVPRWS